MGIYLNPGNAAFMESVNSPIYIDKSELIAHTNAAMNTYRKYICVSRPRRFGKTMAADMLVSYYSKGCDSKGLFSEKKIAEDSTYEEHLNKHHVIRIDIQRFLFEEQDVYTFINDIQRAVIKDLIHGFPVCENLEPEMRLQSALDEIFSQQGEKFSSE